MVAQLGNHSNGAVGNALNSLVCAGEALQTGTAPRTYVANTLTPAAAERGTGPESSTRSSGSASLNTPADTQDPGKRRSGTLGASGPIERPNGTKYHPRQLAHLPDVEVLSRLRDANVPVVLYGPPGTGKTSLVEAAFPDLITVAGDGDTEVADLVGEYTQRDDGSYEFIYGPLVVAMKEGRALLIDDATLISPKVLAALYPAMDGRRQIQLKALGGEVVTAADGFYVTAGHNPGVHGAVMTEALASRFSVQIQVGSDYDLAIALGVSRAAVRIARNLARRADADEVGWAPQLRELLAHAKIEKLLGSEAAFANLVGIAPPEDRDVVSEVIEKVIGSSVTPLSLGRQI
ncbi:AAA family ATPase [Streptomyces sp. AJS327]|nr:AAA family ATPase [Streptomyces sp. AJS327]MBA0049776.1 AAA family ATPase [Streptomyces sp. AJS327]